MAYYSDPTAARALGCINREFERLEKKAKRLYELRREGKISESSLEKAQSQFTGIYRHVLTNVIKEAEEKEKREDEKSPTAQAVGDICGY